MAVTKADKQAELQLLEGMFHGADAAILIDYKGINVPQVTELRRELKKASASYKVVKNTLAKRALEGHRPSRRSRRTSRGRPPSPTPARTRWRWPRP